MDSREIHMAMFQRQPVMYEGVRYDRVAEYVSWYDNTGHHHLSAVLLKQNYSIRVPAEKVQKIGVI